MDADIQDKKQTLSSTKIFDRNTSYINNGITYFDNMFYTDELYSKMLELSKHVGIIRNRLFNDPDTGGTTRHNDVIVSTEDILKVAPEVNDMYEKSRIEAQNVSGRKVLSSPFENSRITLKVYEGRGAEHGWHNDTNSLSGILCLTDNLDDAPLVYCKPKSKIVQGSVFCEKGKLIILKGHDIWHRVEPVQKEDTIRMTLIFNYYHPGEERRLENFDDGYYQ